MLTEEELEQIINDYIFAHRNDEWPMDKPIEELKKDAIEWSENNVE